MVECTALQGDHERRMMTLEKDMEQAKIDVLALQIKESATQVKLDRIIEDLQTLMDRPQKRFDALIAVLISAPVSTLVGVLVSRLVGG